MKHKKVFLLFLLIILIIGVVAAGKIYPSNYIVSGPYCLIFGCTIEGNLTVWGELIVLGNTTNLTIINLTIIINNTQVANENWWNVTGEPSLTGIYEGDYILNTSNESIVSELTITSLSDCDTINTTSDGKLICGDDGGGGGAGDNLGNHVANQNITNVTGIVGRNRSYKSFEDNGDIVTWL